MKGKPRNQKSTFLPKVLKIRELFQQTFPSGEVRLATWRLAVNAIKVEAKFVVKKGKGITGSTDHPPLASKTSLARVDHRDHRAPSTCTACGLQSPAANRSRLKALTSERVLLQVSKLTR